MTMQIPDQFSVNGERYEIMAASELMEFSFATFGCDSPVCWDVTGNYRGYQCFFSIAEDEIFLEGFTIGTENRGESRYKTFTDLHYPLKYSGNLILARDNFYGSCIIPTVWYYREIKEFRFLEGILMEVVDHSAMAADLISRACPAPKAENSNSIPNSKRGRKKLRNKKRLYSKKPPVFELDYKGVDQIEEYISRHKDDFAEYLWWMDAAYTIKHPKGPFFGRTANPTIIFTKEDLKKYEEGMSFLKHLGYYQDS